jgi:hypothetical protein
MTTIDLADFGTGTVTASNSTEIDVTGAGGVLLYKLIGTGFTTFDTNGFPTDGTVTAFDFGHSTGQAASFTGLSMSATTFMNYVSDNDITGFETTALSGNDHLIGYHGNDVLVGEAGNDNFNLSKGGNDTAQGGAGNDYFELGAALTAADSIDGGTGSDKVALNGDYSGGVTFGAATVTNVEAIVLAAGHNYLLTANDGNVASGATMTINGEALGAGNFVNFDGSAETNGTYHLEGGAGNDTLTGGALADTFILNKGGNDTVNGGAGDDYIQFGTSFTAADTVNGGAGNDRIVLEGNYAAGVTMGATALTSVEAIVMDAGFSYKIIENDANLAAGQTMTVNASLVTDGTHTLYFDGSAETNGNFTITGGSGNDTLIGGAGNDVIHGNGGNDYIDISAGGEDNARGGVGGGNTFYLGGAFDGGDIINGAISTNNTAIFDGDYSAGLTVVGDHFLSINHVRFGAGHSYNLNFDFSDTPLAYHALTSFDASALGAGDSLDLNFAPAGDASLMNVTVTGGAGNDIIHAENILHSTIDLSHGGSDTVYLSSSDTAAFGTALDSTDQAYGINTGSIVSISGNYSGLTLTGSMLHSIKEIDLTPNYTYSLAGDSTLAALTLHVTDNSTGSLTFDGSAMTHSLTIESGSETLNLTGGSANDTFEVTTATGGGSIHGGGGDDIASWGYYSASDSFDGGTGNDTLHIEDNDGTSLTLSSANVTNVENLNIGLHTTVVLDDGVVGTGEQMYVTGGSSTIDDSADTNGTIDAVITSGTMIGGSGDDIFVSNGGIGTMTGNGGADQMTLSNDNQYSIIYHAASDSTGTGFDTMTGFNTSFDKFDTPNTITGVDATVTSGALNTASFDTDLAAAVGAGQLAANHAVEFTPTSGDYTGDTFLIVDLNGTAGYQAGHDLVIEIVGLTGTLTTANFI